jgi:hypothetical protein
VDWPKFAKRLLLADGRISELETDLLKRARSGNGASKMSAGTMLSSPTGLLTQNARISKPKTSSPREIRTKTH